MNLEKSEFLKVIITIQLNIMEKINWQIGIFLFYTFFATVLTCQVYKSTQYNNNLDGDNSYGIDLISESTRNKLNNSNSLETPLRINYYDILQLVELEFPKEMKNITGNILFHQAANEKEKVRLPVEVGMDNCINVFIRTLKPGAWKIEVDWIGDGTHYLDKTMILVPDYIPDELITVIL